MRTSVLGALLLCLFACGPGTGQTSRGGDGGGTGSAGDTDGASGTGLATGSAPMSCDVEHEGDLDIDGTVDLAELGAITRVSGDLFLHDTDFTDLSALPCLGEVTGRFLVFDNPVLSGLGGADKLVSIGAEPGAHVGELDVRRNQALESLAGLSALRSAGALIVNDNLVLDDIGLPALEQLGWLSMGECVAGSLGESVEARGDNPALTAIGEFASLQNLGAINVVGQASLESLAALTGLAAQGVAFGAATFSINSELSLGEIESFTAAAGLNDVMTCQNKDEEQICFCPPD